MPALRLRLRATCVTCGNPVPLTGAELAIVCPTCDAPMMLDASAFQWVMPADVTSRTPSENAVVLGEAVPAVVECGACQTHVDDASIELGCARGGLICRCGRAIHLRAVPRELDAEQWWGVFVGESVREKVPPTTQPVHFTCPSCGGALLVDGATRTPACRHCATRAYLPDDLWRALRPTPRAEPFYLWVDPAWQERWTEERRAAIKWAIVVAIVAYAALVVGAVATGNEAIYGPAVAAGWMPAWAAADIAYGRLKPERA